MNLETLAVLETGPVALTPTSETKGREVKLKVFWKTVRHWTDAFISDFQTSTPKIIQKLEEEGYWSKDGAIKNHVFTCEDFAIRILCEFATPRGLPVKLRTGVRTYRNMELYTPQEHDRYLSHMYGFSEMVMLTFGAPDMQRVEENTLSVVNVDNLLQGDILAQAHDRTTGIAHHIQIVTERADNTISIKQGNTSGASFRPVTTIKRMLGSNMADPQSDGYAGMSIESGHYEKLEDGWRYHNTTKGTSTNDFLKIFQFYRWNFMEFNK
ncbi:MULTISPECIES: hypothetical protein [unclassified Pseudomonas]|uniref:hypothetical protein n=1 Tax=unclassified Pseudomonas TaxID=196821 RepID=UPI002AC8BD15|nr:MULTISPECIES: hypothetical protein [unclassified Pseudomonas]MEB0040046.1 hypothetical protein [Pseudomonas sp. MH10]MEB0076445.1 hypothetical protein [Pseudomonas sp. MH10out]MEB0091206.1 hypothetical protein [Pseudomonas sp. CCI4.2]MEB0100840.1 hypothetical protein [Pseudomonas sp. CCI3.2]MEB0119572.1 hypothetical protein [Pseudomonas sp. CCI1.2]